MDGCESPLTMHNVQIRSDWNVEKATKAAQQAWEHISSPGDHNYNDYRIKFSNFKRTKDQPWMHFSGVSDAQHLEDKLQIYAKLDRNTTRSVSILLRMCLK